MPSRAIANAFSASMQESIQAVIEDIEFAKSNIVATCQGTATLSAAVHCSGHRECHGRHYGEPGNVRTCFVHPANCKLAGMSNTNEPSATGYRKAAANQKETDGLGFVKTKMKYILKDVVARQEREELCQIIADGIIGTCTNNEEAASAAIRQIRLPSTPLCIALKIEATAKAITRILHRFLPESRRLCGARISVPVQPYPSSAICQYNLADPASVELLQKILRRLRQCEEQFLEAAVLHSLFAMPAIAHCQDKFNADEADKLDAEAAPKVTEYVVHPEEEIALRDVDLLCEQAEHDWADSVSEVIRSDMGSTEEGDELEHIFLFPYMRAPEEFKDALLEGPELGWVREQMRAAGQQYMLQPSGAKIFVWPEQYSAVLGALSSKEIQLRSSYVIIAQSLLPSLEASIATIRSKKNVRPKSGGIICVARASVRTVPSSVSGDATNGTDEGRAGAEQTTISEDSDDECWQHTFDVQRLCLVRVLRNPGSVNQSTTEARGGVNPRRYGGVDPAPVSTSVGKGGGY